MAANLSLKPLDLLLELLCLGPQLGPAYLSSLKNTPLCHLNYGDVIDIVLTVLRSLRARVLPSEPLQWIDDDIARVSQFLDKKQLADKSFRQGEFESAAWQYQEASRVRLFLMRTCSSHYEYY